MVSMVGDLAAWVRVVVGWGGRMMRRMMLYASRMRMMRRCWMPIMATTMTKHLVSLLSGMHQTRCI